MTRKLSQETACKELRATRRRTWGGFPSGIETDSSLLDDSAMSSVARGAASHLGLKPAHTGARAYLDAEGRTWGGFPSGIETLQNARLRRIKLLRRTRGGFPSGIETVQIRVCERDRLVRSHAGRLPIWD